MVQYFAYVLFWGDLRVFSAGGAFVILRVHVPGPGEATKAPLPGVRGDREKHQEAALIIDSREVLRVSSTLP